MILKIEKPIPEYALRQVEKCDFNENVRRCEVFISEEDAVTYIHPESFDFSDVFGNCELAQMKKQPAVIARFEFEKNHRSFEKEALRQQDKENGH